jgi:hypothetical protein
VFAPFSLFSLAVVDSETYLECADLPFVLCVHRLLVAMIQTTTTTGCKCLILFWCFLWPSWIRKPTLNADLPCLLCVLLLWPWFKQQQQLQCVSVCSLFSLAVVDLKAYLECSDLPCVLYVYRLWPCFKTTTIQVSVCSLFSLAVVDSETFLECWPALCLCVYLLLAWCDCLY